MAAYSGCRLLFDCEVKAARIPNRPDHPEAVFSEAGFSVADRANGAPLEVVSPSNIVEESLLMGGVKHAVYGEVAPLRILFGARCDVASRTPPVDVVEIGAEGGDFKGVSIEDHNDNAK